MPTSAHSPASTELVYVVEGMSCSRCEVDVDLDSELVRVHGTGADAAAVPAAIDEAGYDTVTA